VSAAVSHVQPDPEQNRSAPESVDDTATGAPPLVVRRNAGLAALIGAAASAIAIAYLWRAIGSTTPVDWVLCGLLAVIATFHLAHLVDARTPLLVADDLGVRVRLGNHWRGLPWDAVREVVVQPPRGLLRDGRLVFVPDSLPHALDGLDARGRRAVALNQKMYGAALAVPMGLGTRFSVRGAVLAADLAALSRGRTDVVVRSDAPVEASTRPVATPPEAPPAADTRPVEPGALGSGDDAPERGAPVGRRLLGGVGSVVSRVSPLQDNRRRLRSVTRPDSTTTEPEGRTPDPLEASSVPATDGTPEVKVVTPTPEPPAPAGPQRSDRASAGDGRAHPVPTLADPVGAPVDGFVTEPARDSVIGPELAAARIRVGLSVDELAERTRIRPHVIESIEVDDFAPCGGDFYARGHLRTLARVLGRDPAVLLEQFDRRYAGPPVDARRVFEAELATGMTGSMRSTVGGPSWALMVAAVVVLVLVWAVMRLFASEPAEQLRSPVPVLSGSTGAVRPPPATVSAPLQVTLAGARGGSQVVVRDRAGTVVWSGSIAAGEHRTVDVPPPVHVRVETGGVVSVALDGADQGVLGQVGRPGLRTFHRSDAGAQDTSGPGATPTQAR
jgi:cytoskeleton protein RodZ